jgi:hypothetical protein
MSARLLLLLGVALWSAPPAGAQSGPPVERFDLVLVGDHLRTETHRVALKTNPTVGAAWRSLDDTACPGTARLLVVPNLSVSQYLGQDVRENHLTLRVRTPSPTGSNRGALRAVYALPFAGSLTPSACTRLLRLTRTTPHTVRRHSLASHERPRPLPLRPGTPFLEHVEAPVRHRRPGVMEVEWLNLLFGQEE